MKKLLLRQVLLDNKNVDVLIAGNRFAQIAPSIAATNETELIDGTGYAIVPPFYNTHGHAAMTLFRGFADDIELFPWLHKYIWPAEKLLTPDDVACASRLAIVEMIRSGTVFFNDMYWYQAIVAQVAHEMGMRAAIGRFFIEESPGKVHPLCLQQTEELETIAPSLDPRIQITYAPHAIYTVSGTTLKRIAAKAKETGQIIHIHAAETLTECEQCQKEHQMTPIAWIDACGLLGSNTILAHGVHLTKDDIARIRDSGASIAHMPVSNAKLCSGIFRFHDVATLGGCRVTIGTDGCASNNNLSMFDEIKMAALSSKITHCSFTAAPAAAIWDAATRQGAAAFNINAGVIAPGYLADALLIALKHPAMVPNYNLTANLVYAADPSVVDTVICDGQILMRHRKIPGEEEIVTEVERIARRYAPLARKI
jgi:5-methylthioadenosine/S-adenosylhomocysteine deaminase